MLNLKSLLQTETPADIAAALKTINIPALQAEVDSATEKRAGLLLSGTNAEIIAAEGAIENARLDVERAGAAGAELERRLAAAVEAERVATLTAKRTEITRERDEVARQLDRDYGKHANALVTLLNRIKSSDARINQFNLACEANQSGTEFQIDRGSEAIFLKEGFSSVFGDITNFANIPAAPGVGGFWSGKAH